MERIVLDEYYLFACTNGHASCGPEVIAMHAMAADDAFTSVLSSLRVVDDYAATNSA